MSKIVGVLMFFGAIIAAFSSSKGEAAYPFPHFVSYHNASTLSHYTPKQAAKRVAEYYQIWKKDFLVKEGTFYRIATDKNDTTRTVSEGQGYGMMIVALMAGEEQDAQLIFDGLYRFAKAHPSEIEPTFMTWQVPAKKGESDSAFDGDADIAYALMLASKQWGDSGQINYAKEATKMIDALVKKVIGKDSYLPLLGDWVAQDGKKYNQYTTRTSDFMLSHFRAFYRFREDKRWLKVIAHTQKALEDIQTLSTNKTGLVSDFIYHDKKKGSFLPTKRDFLEGQDDSYYYNACRVPWRIGLDALLSGDKNSIKSAKKLTAWIAKTSSQKATQIKAGYRLSGKVIDDSYYSAVFIAPFGVSAKLDTAYQPLLDDVYEVVKSMHENYFEDSVNLLSQLIMIDAFWDPTTVK
jgi:endo-1,4-beta-D-glucanase Y